ncbi:MAG: hypothetical protein IJY70_04325 [Clostridia bacterium]|nr:hypothetical protein [Clostridia bacterium]
MKSLRHFTPQISEETKPQNPADQYNRYMNMSEDELLNALYKSIEKSKRDGAFDGEKLRGMVNLVRDKLTAEQARKLDELLNKIT